VFANFTTGLLFLFSFMYDEAGQRQIDLPTNISSTNSTQDEIEIVNRPLFDSDPNTEVSNITSDTNIDNNVELNEDPEQSNPSSEQVDETIGRKQPNVVIILADDMGTGDIPSYWGEGSVNMTNIGDMVSKGVLFTDAHSTPLCAPSRYMLLSGNYQHQGRNPWGTWNLGSFNQFRQGQSTFAQVLRDEANYHTAMMGKWHLGGVVPPLGRATDARLDRLLQHESHDWTLPLGEGPQDVGFDSSLISAAGVQNSPYSFIRDGIMDIEAVNNTYYWKKGTYSMPKGKSKIKKRGDGSPQWDSTAYNQILVEETIRFIDHHSATRSYDPFLAYVALGAVHGPHSPPDQYLDESTIAGKYDSPHLDLLGEVDKVVGSIVSAIEERGLANDTILIFTSDNGGLGKSKDFGHFPSGPLQGQKGSVYEGGHRVPLIIRWDNTFPTGVNRTHLVGLNDIFATLCELAGIDVPHGQALDSKSFANYIKTNNSDGLRQSLGIWRYVKTSLQSEALRRNKLKLIRSGPDDSSVELYNLENDIGETVDLSSDAAYEMIKNDMLDELKKIGPCSAAYKEDNPGEFAVSGESTLQMCDWFIERPSRCSNYVEGREHCPSSCKNSKFSIEGEEKKKSCKWFESNNKRCNKHPEGRLNCPNACFKGFC